MGAAARGRPSARPGDDHAAAAEAVGVEGRQQDKIIGNREAAHDAHRQHGPQDGYNGGKGARNQGFLIFFPNGVSLKVLLVVK